MIPHKLVNLNNEWICVRCGVTFSSLMTAEEIMGQACVGVPDYVTWWDRYAQNPTMTSGTLADTPEGGILEDRNRTDRATALRREVERIQTDTGTRLLAPLIDDLIEEDDE